MFRALALSVLWLITALVTLPEKGAAQNPQTAAEPEFQDVFYHLEAGKLVPLERQTGIVKGKASGFIVMSMKAVYDYPGGKSSVRVRSGERLEFVVRSFAAKIDVDPNTQYRLRKLESKKDKRELVVSAGHASPVGASMKTDLARGILPVTFSRYGNASYKLTTESLPPGEYALSREYVQTVFCFGVD